MQGLEFSFQHFMQWQWGIARRNLFRHKEQTLADLRTSIYQAVARPSILIRWRCNAPVIALTDCKCLQRAREINRETNVWTPGAIGRAAGRPPFGGFGIVRSPHANERVIWPVGMIRATVHGCDCPVAFKEESPNESSLPVKWFRVRCCAQRKRKNGGSRRDRILGLPQS